MARRSVVLAAIAGCLLAAGCDSQFEDIDQGQVRTEAPAEAIQATVTNPDSITVFRNLDGFPNLARMCVDGIAFYMTSHSDARAAALHAVPDSGDCAR